MESKELDLKNYGIRHVLSPKSDVKQFTKDILQRGYVEYLSDSNAPSMIYIGQKDYIILQKLGSGTFGTTYKALDADTDKVVAIKVIKFTPDRLDRDINSMIQESIIQIILAKDGANQAYGPSVPHLYKVAYDPDNYLAFLVIELLDDTVDNLLHRTTVTKEKAEQVIILCLWDIAKTLDRFGTRYNMNHRDLKPDNIMYKKDESTNKYFFKLIDFGFTCIHWHGLRLQGNNYFNKSRPCYVPGRDLTQLIYAIYMFLPGKLTRRMDDFLHQFLHVLVGKESCNMTKTCTQFRMSTWKNTYDFLDSSRVKTKLSSSHLIFQELKRFTENKPFLGYLEKPMAAPPPPVVLRTPNAPKACPPGKTYNPATKRCRKTVKAKSKKTCPDGKELNPKTGRCIQTRKAKVKICPEGKEINPKTGRCIKIRI
jgi:serine/threonine protein kinase